MAYDLTARLTLQDRFSNRLSRATREIRKAERRSEELKKTLTNIGDRARSSTGSIKGLTTSFVGLGAAIGGAMAAKKLFDKTIVGAAKYEQSEVTIRAMFRDDKKAADFMQRMDKLALDSPLLNSQDIFGNAKSLISYTKDVDKLEDLFKLGERLAAAVPEQGTDGAIYALAEMLSGDGQSIVERFRLPRSVVNDIKKMKLEDQVVALDKLLDKMGFSSQLVDDMGNTTLGLWNQIKEKADVVLRTMGQPALSKIRNFLDKLNREMENGDKNGFLKFGKDLLSSLAEGFISGVESFKTLINTIVTDPEFIKAEGVGGKGKFILEKFYEGLNSWLDGGGQSKIEKAIASTLTLIINAIGNYSDDIVKAGGNLGKEIGGAIVAGIRSAISENPLAKAVLGAGVGAAAGSVIPGVGTLAGGVIGGAGSLIDHYSDKAFNFLNPGSEGGFMKDLESGKYSGTIREAVGNNGGGYKGAVGDSVKINISNMNVRKESDIDEIASALSHKLNTARGLTPR